MAATAFTLNSLEYGKRALGLAIVATRAGRLSRPHLAELAGIGRERMLDIELGAESIPTDEELVSLATVLSVSPAPWIAKAKLLRAEAETKLAGKGTTDAP
jgi:transcriptional regulator with XRE-family HTH domain